MLSLLFPPPWQRILSLSSEQAPKRLRVAVEGGGCSGFQYTFILEDDNVAVDEEDKLFERDGARVVVDEVSLDLVRGSTVDYVQEMIRSSFAINNNPNSESACGAFARDVRRRLPTSGLNRRDRALALPAGCGSSFALKAFADNPAVD